MSADQVSNRKVSSDLIYTNPAVDNKASTEFPESKWNDNPTYTTKSVSNNKTKSFHQRDSTTQSAAEPQHHVSQNFLRSGHRVHTLSIRTAQSKSKKSESVIQTPKVENMLSCSQLKGLSPLISLLKTPAKKSAAIEEIKLLLTRTSSKITDQHLLEAIESGSSEVVKLILQHTWWDGCDQKKSDGNQNKIRKIQLNNFRDENLSPLCKCIEKGDIEMIKILFAAGAQLNNHYKHNRNIFHVAAENGNLKVFDSISYLWQESNPSKNLNELLLAKDSNTSQTPIDLALEYGSADLCSYLIIAKPIIIFPKKSVADGEAPYKPLERIKKRDDITEIMGKVCYQNQRKESILKSKLQASEQKAIESQVKLASEMSKLELKNQQQRKQIDDLTKLAYPNPSKLTTSRLSMIDV